MLERISRTKVGWAKRTNQERMRRGKDSRQLRSTIIADMRAPAHQNPRSISRYVHLTNGRRNPVGPRFVFSFKNAFGPLSQFRLADLHAVPAWPTLPRADAMYAARVSQLDVACLQWEPIVTTFPFTYLTGITGHGTAVHRAA